MKKSKKIPQRVPPPSIDSILNNYFAFESSLLSNVDNDYIASTTHYEHEHDHDHGQHHAHMSYLNHGGFGDPHPSVLTLRHHLTQMCYKQPMVYHRSIVPALVSRAKQRACDYLKIPSSCKNKEEESCHRDGFSFVSVTPALFGVLGSVQFKKGDVIVTSDMIYHSLVDAISHMSHTYQLDWITVPSPHGCHLDEIYNAFEQVLNDLVLVQKRNVKLCVFDHISSKPSVMFPVQKICTLCHSLKVPTLVDGAHVPGSIPSLYIDIGALNATFYCVTFHKWVNTPRGSSGGLWVNKQNVETLYSSFIDISRIVIDGGWLGLSNDSNNNNNNNENDGNKNKTIMEMYLDASKPGYLTDGLTQGIYDESTREYENIMVLPHCLDIVLKKEEALQAHAMKLRRDSIQILSSAWNMTLEEATIWCGGSDDVALPMLSFPLPTLRLLKAIRFHRQKDTSSGSGSEKSNDLSLPQKLKLIKKHVVLKLWNEYAIEVPIFVWKGTDVGVRISFGRHVVMDDIQRLGDAINEITEKGFDVEQ